MITDINEQTLQETADLTEELNPQVQLECVVGDLTSEEFVNKAVSQAIDAFGALHYAVNAAGISGKSMGTDEMGFEEYRRVQRVNMESVWLCERAELKAMLRNDLVDGYYL